MSNPAQHIVFHCSGEETHRSARLWNVLKVLSADELQQIAWIGDHKGCLQLGLRHQERVSISLLKKAKEIWRQLGEDMMELYGPSPEIVIFEEVMD